MQPRSLFFRLFSCLALFQLAAAVTKRTALVRVRNDTPDPIRRVSVLHKYSTNYKNRGSWDLIQPGQVSDTFTVEYNTGAFTTGRDWWLVSWENKDQTRFYFSDPKNGRRLFDMIEGLIIAKKLDQLLNAESTTGFKQHILRASDEGKVAEIVLNRDGTITIRSESGTSNTVSSSTPIGTAKTKRKPFYAIAHRVLDKAGVEAAVRHGANAIETDARPLTRSGSQGWWGDHDGSLTSKNDRMSDVIAAIAKAHSEGNKIAFVWLDLKNPDKCNQDKKVCNIEALRDMTRTMLEPIGVRVLWSFSDDDIGGRSWKVIRDGLSANEALGVDGTKRGGVTSDKGRKFFEDGPANIAQRVWSKGLFWPHLKFGSCEDSAVESDKNDICPQVRKAVESKAFGKVFAWTIARNDIQQAQMLMYAGVDGLIYGPVASKYQDDSETRDSLKLMTDWLAQNQKTRYLGTSEDKPW